MVPDQWTDYLEAACAHLRATRLAVEAGRPGPPGPPRPSGPPPEELLGRVQVLAAGYDQLALEVATHLSVMQRYRRTHVPQAPPASHFVDQRV
jgi:hypothetical protein